ncbi:Hypothetical predicted protein [Olea europaea subsp. europaea]|uniref:Uncharacterized protein n=1 Tax=Olea europaea subsp. europaea TaxID=158383 RepID=A0A8S0SXZ2_OLEEU|nr:Hypothetical predicted protein [Olea europaea subsp. europaea]
METWINVMNELAPSARKARRIQLPTSLFRGKQGTVAATTGHFFQQSNVM